MTRRYRTDGWRHRLAIAGLGLFACMGACSYDTILRTLHRAPATTLATPGQVQVFRLKGCHTGEGDAVTLGVLPWSHSPDAAHVIVTIGATPQSEAHVRGLGPRMLETWHGDSTENPGAVFFDIDTACETGVEVSLKLGAAATGPVVIDWDIIMDAEGEPEVAEGINRVTIVDVATGTKYESASVG